jgi:hypothetical protein
MTSFGSAVSRLSLLTLAAYAYLQESSGLERAGSPIRPGAPPWRLNAILQERHAFVPGSDRLAVNLGLHDTFIRRQSPSLSKQNLP